MKKFWVGALSIFVLLGGIIFTACDKNKVSLSLSDTYKEICINENQEDKSELITAVVNGTDKGLVSVSSSFENIVRAEVVYNSATGKNEITLTGVSEGSAEVIVRSLYQSNVSEVINVNVYSEVLGMEQKAEDVESGKSNFYAVKNGQVDLAASQLISFTNNTRPTVNRKEIIWSLPEGTQGARIEGKTLYVESEFSGNGGSEGKILVDATAKDSPTAATTQIELSLIDAIQPEDIKLEYTYASSGGSYDELINNGSISVTTNITTDDNYRAYVKITFAGNKEISIEPQVKVAGTGVNEIIKIARIGNPQIGTNTITYTYEITAFDDNVNGDAIVNFDISYKDFAYKVSSNSFKVKCYEKINTVSITNEQNSEVDGETSQEIYTNYKNTFGKLFNINLLPQSVIGATNQFNITIKYPFGYSDGTNINGDVTADTLQIYYPTSNSYKQFELNKVEDGSNVIFSTNNINLPSNVTKIYIKANDGHILTQILNVEVTITPVENTNVSKTIKLDLFKSATELSFENDQDANAILPTSLSSPDVIEKEFTLEGQTTIAGLKTIYSADKDFKVSDPIYVSNTTTSLTFKVLISVTEKGATNTGWFKFTHENGIESKKYAVDLFLPLEDGTIKVNNYEEFSEKITDFSMSGSKLYQLKDGALTEVEGAESLNRMMIKNASTILLNISTNLLNTNFAVAKTQFSYLDYTGITDADFINWMNQTPSDIINNAKELSRHLTIYNSTLTSTAKEGFTYAVVKFIGHDENHEEITYVRIIQVEVHVPAIRVKAVNSNAVVYAQNSVNNIEEIKQEVKVVFGDVPVTHISGPEGSYFKFTSAKLGQFDEKTQTWANSSATKYYTLNNVKYYDTYLTFEIIGETTDGQPLIDDDLMISYTFHNINMSDNVNVRIKNADRLENVVWENYDKNGVYFEANASTSQSSVLVLTARDRQTAKNTNLFYYVTDETGNASQSVKVESLNNNGLVTIKTSVGATGYIYVLPEDAINAGSINYYYIADGVEYSASILVRELPSSFNFLFENGYFKNNKEQKILFENILIKIPFTIADGRNWDTAYRLYNESDFKSIEANSYYTVMNSVEINNWKSMDFSGGIQGLDSTVSIMLNGESFINRNEGTIRNLKFFGNVLGNGFIANANAGTISNVTIDVDNSGNKVRPSSVTGVGFVGGLVGENESNGVIESANILGMQILAGSPSATKTAELNYAAGIAGKNSGKIKNARVELYAFEGIEDGNVVHSFIKGDVAAGLIGVMSGGEISLSYVYDYSLSQTGTSKIFGEPISATNNNAAVAAAIFKFDGGRTSQIFAVVNLQSFYNSQNGGVTGDYYNSYYELQTASQEYKYVSDLNKIDGNENNWITNGEYGYQVYVNGGNAYFKNIQQSKQLESINAVVKTLQDNRGYFKALEVNANKGAMFFYDVEVQGELSENMINTLAQYNTISLAEMIDGYDNAMAIASSNPKVAKIIGNQLVLLSTGAFELKLYSRFNYTINKIIQVQVVKALSTIKANQTLNDKFVSIDNGSIVSLQLGKSMAVSFDMQHPYIYLGREYYPLIKDDYKFTNDVVVKGENTENLPLPILSGNNILNIQTSNTTAKDSTITSYIDYSAVLTDSDIIASIRSQFKSNFDLALFEGAIKLYTTGDELVITPSGTGIISAELQTNSKDDALTISIYFGDRKLSNVDGVYSLDGQKRIVVSSNQTNLSQEDASNLYTKKFDMTFEVERDYRGKIDSEQEYKVVVSSNHQVTSAEFVLRITKQSFTNVASTSFKADSTIVSGAQQYTKGIQTSVISPGDVALLDFLVSPEFAYYDHATLTVSNAPSANAVILNYMALVENGELPYYIDASASVNADGNGLLLTSENIKGSKSKLTFKVWLNPNVVENANLKFTIKFFDAQGVEINGSRANHFLSINYLSVPEVKVEGANEAVVAKGTTAKVEIIVDYDQSVDISSATLVNVIGGINLNSNWVESTNVQGRKVYTSTINITVNARLVEDASEFYVNVLVSRILNGVLERKEARATVKLIDFKVDTDNIEVGSDNVFTTFIGLSQTLNIKYPMLPESYNYDSSDKISADSVAELNSKRKEFAESGFHSDTKQDYYINTYPTGIGSTGNISVRDRLYFWSEETKGWTPIYNSQAGTYYNIGGHLQFKFDEVGNAISFTGVTLTNTNLRFRLITYIGTTSSSNLDDVAKKDTYFEVKVDAYSSEELPLCIRTEQEFYEMATGGQQDYILLNDIVLNNYTPFSTSAIRSLDGNGYTVYINSFNVIPANTTTLKLALFDKVSSGTTLKNIRVNLYNGGQINIDISKYKTINVAGFAISNDGIITNCEVVSFYDSKCSSALTANQGINVRYLNGYNTTENQIYNDFSDWNSQIAGFVIDNAGNITNSRVGGEDFYKIVGSDSSISQDVVSSQLQRLDMFNINGQGDLAGFALNNSGAISATFVDRIAMFNESNSTKKFAAGFVGTNSGRVISSYIEGENNNNETADNFCKQGSFLKSTASIVAGFVYTNNNIIKDCYSNILISNISSATGENYVYLASGFVYTNNVDGQIENCYSASQVTSYKYSQMNFTGLSENGQLRNYASGYVNSYYYASNYLGDTTSAEDTFETGAIRLLDVGNKNFFYGFAFTTKENSMDGVWSISPITGVSLVSANNVAISNRYYVADSSGQEYKLPYAKVKTDEGTIDTNYGKSANPIIIRSAEEFADVTGNSKVTAIKANFTATAINGNYRLVNDIDLATLASGSEDVDIPSARKSFTGSFFGNGFTIDNISISAKETTLAYGLFASVEKAKNSSNGASVVDVNLNVNRVVNGQALILGSLAGIVKDSSIVNVDLTFNETNQVEGRNFVGGLVGYVYGDSKITDINVHGGNVYADRKISGSGEEGVLTIDSAFNFRNTINNIKGDVLAGAVSAITLSQMQKEIDILSYAGMVLGFVDNYNSSNAGTNTYNYVVSRTNEDYNISKIRVDGSIRVQAQVAGGLFGYIGNTTYVKDAGITILSSDENINIYATKYYAGGIVGQLNGELLQTFSEYDAETQTKIENSIKSYYDKSTNAEIGNVDVFACTSEDSIIAIGGLAGLINNGSITQSYSKLNVVNPRASYAGGIVGKVDNLSGSAYSFSDGINPIVTKLLMHEVYAAGDVRGREASGGIIGAMIGGSQAHLMSVNAFNKFTFKNYKENRDYTIEELSTEGALNILKLENVKVYSIAGKLSNASLNFVNKLPEMASDDTQVEDMKISVGVVDSLANKFYNSEVKLSPLAGKEADQTKFNILDGYTAISSIEGGRDNTYGHFLGSALWSTSNWYHNADTLYPNIRLTVADAGYIYLDAYDSSIRDVINTMKLNKHIEVRVRGFESQSSERVVNIDLRAYVEKNGGFYEGVDAYSGRFIWDASYTQGVKPSIFISQPIWKSTGEGFVVQNVKFVLSKTDSATHKEYDQNTIFDAESARAFQGALINETVNAGRFISVEIEVNSSVYLQTETNAGLIAPQMEATDVIGVMINDTRDETLSSLSDEPIMNVKFNNSTSATISNIGLLAGQIIQNSGVKNVSIFNNMLKRDRTFGADTSNSPVITLQESKGKVNVGSFFGYVGKADRTGVDGETVLDMNLQIGAITTYGNQFYTINAISGQTSANIGGVVGQINGAIVDGVYQLSSAGASLINIGIIVNNIGNGGTLNAGLIFGHANTNSCNLNMKGKINGFITGGADLSLATANIGGFAGSNSAPVTFGLDVDVYVGANASTQISRDEIINKHVNDAESVSPAGEKYLHANVANVGTVVGNNTGALSISRTSAGDNVVKLNGSYNQLNVRGEIVHMGAAVGDNSSNKLIIAPDGGIISNAVMSVQDADNNTALTSHAVGGFVGYSSGVVEIGNHQLVGENDIVALFNGLIYSDNATAIIGGLVGQISAVGSQGTSVINRTSFGGAIRFVGANNSTEGKNKFVGGTIGQLDSKVNLTSNYNFGDVYVLTDFTNNYYFGGLIGNVNANITTEEGKENYTLTTNHKANAKGAYEKAVYGNITTTATNVGKNNFYNHGVVMAADESYGKDIAYITPYNKDVAEGTDLNVRGYGYTDTEGYKNSTKSFANYLKGNSQPQPGQEYLFGIFARMINTSYFAILPGCKLNPIDLETGKASISGETYSKNGNVFDNTILVINSIKENAKKEDIYPQTTNGLRYYTEDSKRTLPIEITDLKFQNISHTSNGEETSDERTFKNIAYIGDGYEIDVTYKSDESSQKDHPFKGFIDNLTGQSFISAINIAEDFIIEFATADSLENFGGLVSSMTGGKIYSVGLTGKLEMGGKNVVNIGGFIGTISGENNKRVENSNTSLNILYRAGIKEDAKSTTYANVAGFVSNASAGYVYNSYSVGNVNSFVSANLYGFGQGENGCSVYNSYTTSRLTQNDYTTEETAKGNLGIFKGFKTVGCWYDYESVQIPKVKVEEKEIYPLDSANSSGMSSISYQNSKGASIKFLNSKETRNINFNYGYPIHKTLYLAQSSWQSTKSDASGIPVANPDSNLDDEVYKSTNGRLSEAAKGVEYYTYSRLSALETLQYGNEKQGNVETFNKNLSLVTTTDAEDRVFFYGVPSFGVLDNVVGRQYNIVLENGIDFMFSARSKIFKNFTGTYFDGNDHKISNMTNSLFTEITSGTNKTIRNIYFDNTQAVNVLATNMGDAISTNSTLPENIKVKNITVQGEDVTTGTSSGGLVGTSNNVSFYAVSNLLKITLTSAGNVGGIVGTMNCGGMYYCSNYGIINADITGNTNLGGLAGKAAGIKLTITKDAKTTTEIKKAEIKNSYNSSAIISAITKTSGIAKVGGLVGNASYIDISTCYNTGMIFAGNKQKTTESYAGGFVASSGEGVSINYSYSEGAVEAQGKSGYKFTKASDDSKVYVKQDGSRNVYADPYANGLKDLIGNTCNKNIQVKQNGNFKSEDDIFYTINTSGMGYKKSKTVYASSVLGGYGAFNHGVAVEYKIGGIDVTNGITAAVSYDDFGFPKAVRIAGPLTVTYYKGNGVSVEEKHSTDKQEGFNENSLNATLTSQEASKSVAEKLHSNYWTVDQTSESNILKQANTLNGVSFTENPPTISEESIIEANAVTMKSYDFKNEVRIGGELYSFANTNSTDIINLLNKNNKYYTSSITIENLPVDSNNFTFKKIDPNGKFKDVIKVSGKQTGKAVTTEGFANFTFDLSIVASKDVADWVGFEIKVDSASSKEIDISKLKITYDPITGSTSLEGNITGLGDDNMNIFGATIEKSENGNYDFDSTKGIYVENTANQGKYNLNIDSYTKNLLAEFTGKDGAKKDIFISYQLSGADDNKVGKITYDPNKIYGTLSNGEFIPFSYISSGNTQTIGFEINKEANLKPIDFFEGNLTLIARNSKKLSCVGVATTESSIGHSLINYTGTNTPESTGTGNDSVVFGNLGDVNGKTVSAPQVTVTTSDIKLKLKLLLDTKDIGNYRVKIDAQTFLAVTIESLPDGSGNYIKDLSFIDVDGVADTQKVKEFTLDGKIFKLQINEDKSISLVYEDAGSYTNWSKADFDGEINAVSLILNNFIATFSTTKENITYPPEPEVPTDPVDPELPTEPTEPEVPQEPIISWDEVASIVSKTEEVSEYKNTLTSFSISLCDPEEKSILVQDKNLVAKTIDGTSGKQWELLSSWEGMDASIEGNSIKFENSELFVPEIMSKFSGLKTYSQLVSTSNFNDVKHVMNLDDITRNSITAKNVSYTETFEYALVGNWTTAVNAANKNVPISSQLIVSNDKASIQVALNSAWEEQYKINFAGENLYLGNIDLNLNKQYAKKKFITDIIINPPETKNVYFTFDYNYIKYGETAATSGKELDIFQNEIQTWTSSEKFSKFKVDYSYFVQKIVFTGGDIDLLFDENSESTGFTMDYEFSGYNNLVSKTEQKEVSGDNGKYISTQTNSVLRVFKTQVSLDAENLVKKDVKGVSNNISKGFFTIYEYKNDIMTDKQNDNEKSTYISSLTQEDFEFRVETNYLILSLNGKELLKIGNDGKRYTNIINNKDGEAAPNVDGTGGGKASTFSIGNEWNEIAEETYYQSETYKDDKDNDITLVIPNIKTKDQIVIPYSYQSGESTINSIRVLDITGISWETVLGSSSGLKQRSSVESEVNAVNLYLNSRSASMPQKDDKNLTDEYEAFITSYNTAFTEASEEFQKIDSSQLKNLVQCKIDLNFNAATATSAKFTYERKKVNTTLTQGIKIEGNSIFGNGDLIDPYKDIFIKDVASNNKFDMISNLSWYQDQSSLNFKTSQSDSIVLTEKPTDESKDNTLEDYKALIITRNLYLKTFKESSIDSGVQIFGNNFVIKLNSYIGDGATEISAFSSIGAEINNANFACYIQSPKDIGASSEGVLTQNLNGRLYNVNVYGGASGIYFEEFSFGGIYGKSSEDAKLENLTFLGFLHGNDSEIDTNNQAKSVTTKLYSIGDLVISHTSVISKGVIFSGNGTSGKDGKNGENGTEAKPSGTAGVAAGTSGGSGGGIAIFSTDDISTSIIKSGDGGNAGAGGSGGSGFDAVFNESLTYDNVSYNNYGVGGSGRANGKIGVNGQVTTLSNQKIDSSGNILIGGNGYNTAGGKSGRNSLVGLYAKSAKHNSNVFDYTYEASQQRKFENQLYWSWATHPIYNAIVIFQAKKFKRLVNDKKYLNNNIYTVDIKIATYNGVRESTSRGKIDILLRNSFAITSASSFTPNAQSVTKIELIRGT